MRKMIILGLLLLFSGCQKDTSTVTAPVQEGEPFLKTDKDSDNDDETIELTIQNESASALYFQCHVPDGGGREYLIILYQEKQNDNWEDPIGFPYPTGWTIAKRLESGKSHVDSIQFTPPGIYRFLIPFSWVYQINMTDTLYSNEFINSPLFQ